ncbi:MAG: PAS domain S-box protein [Chloroflexota bacterium]
MADHYRSLLVASGHIILSLDRRGVFIEATPNTSDLTGYQPDELIGRYFRTLIHPAWYPQVFRAINLQNDPEVSRSSNGAIDYPIVTNLGGERWVRQHLIRSDAGDDKPVELVLAPLNGSGSAHNTPADEQAHSRAMFDATFEMLVLHDGDSVVDVNPVFEQVFGYDRAAAQQITLEALLPNTLNPGIRGQLDIDRKSPIQALAVRHDGAYFPVEIRTRSIIYQGRMVRAIAMQDIADRLRVERQIRARDELYRTLASNLPETAVLLYDRDLNFMLAEGQLIDQLNIDVVGGGVTAMFDTSLSKKAARQLELCARAALKGDRCADQVVHNDHVLSLQFVPVRDGDGAIFAGMAVVRDITEQQRTEMALRQSERRFRGLFEHNNDAVLFIDLDGCVKDANHQMSIMLGYSREELIGMDISAYIDYRQVDPDYPADDPDQIKERLLRGQRQPIYLRTFRRKDGETFPAEINISLVYDRDGQPLHFQSIVRDVTERKQFEAQLAERIKHLTTLRMVDEELTDRLDVEYVVVMGLDSAMRLSAADAGFISLLQEDGRMHTVSVAGDYEDAALAPQRRDEAGILGHVVQTQQAIFVDEVASYPGYHRRRSRTVSQITVPLMVRDQVIGVLNLECNRAGRFTEETSDLIKLLTGRISVAIDNARLYNQTETQLAQLRDLYEQVSALEQLKTDMIRVAAHDLRNPLSAIIGCVELIKMDLEEMEEPGEITEQVENMSQSADRMQRIIDDILSLDRIERSVKKEDQPTIDLTELAHSVYAENLELARHRHRRLRLAAPAEPVIVRGDRVELAEVLTNLIDNAFKYTDDGGNVEVRLHSRGRHALVEVVDDGFGIPQEKQGRLFQPFYRVTTAETSDIKGTGLGLHLVKNIVERHGGTMIFESVYQKGSTFGFRLPLQHEV